jgi:hypothetical protein
MEFITNVIYMLAGASVTCYHFGRLQTASCIALLMAAILIISMLNGVEFR